MTSHMRADISVWKTEGVDDWIFKKERLTVSRISQLTFMGSFFD